MKPRLARHDRHVDRLSRAFDAKSTREDPLGPSRGETVQRARREIERAVRRAAVGKSRWLGLRGRSVSWVAAAVGLVQRTLRRWIEEWADDRLVVESLGRPAERGRADQRSEVLGYLTAHGGELSLRALADAFPEMSRAELRDLKRRWRKMITRKEFGRLFHMLSFTVPGTVWAMDFTEPKRPVDGIFRYLFVVRDLASGRHLAVMPVYSKESKSAQDVLRALFLWHPPPLVLKSDNDKAFKTAELRELLKANGVLPLYSPPYYPQYNGACESGIGTIKVFAHHESANRGHPGEFTANDIFAAVCRGNSLTRPHGHDGPTPDEAWRGSVGVLEWDRERMARRYAKEYRLEVEEQGYPTLFDLDPADKEKVDRAAIGRALIKCGFLCVKRRRVLPPIKYRKRDIISRT